MASTAFELLMELTSTEDLVDVLSALERRALQYEAEGDGARHWNAVDTITKIKACIYDRQMPLFPPEGASSAS